MANLSQTVHGYAFRGRVRPEYRSWAMMLHRCTNQNYPRYSDYGGRGITVCERWLKFENFIADMGNRPSDGHSIERKDNNLGYSPDNCVWATAKEQMRNRRNSRMLTFEGRTQCLSAWSEEIGVCVPTLYKRISKGWSVERALGTPVDHSRATRGRV